ncbi:ferric reductase-like transmembrane domain-containing protein [Patescibacteria group bacterium]|nr:ferric reductase-like transmembrane domain-containing protein [Patescibacteria group bacterium]MDL1953504.1 oxidoreductase [Candidatus Uhrbacteria bacterium UHB]RIL00506.1 MAG: oxidoreductase [Candidatus Uhrbacteria bacterium]
MNLRHRMWGFAVILLLAAHFLVIAWFWWQGSSALFRGMAAGSMLALGRLFGLLAVSGILLQFMLIGRAVWIERLFGLDKLTRVHAWNGYATFGFVLAHPLFITLAYADFVRANPLRQFVHLVTGDASLLAAAIAVILLIGVVLLSIAIVRRRLKYETWYYAHLLTYAVVGLAFFHQLPLGGDFLQSGVFTAYWYGLYIFVFGNVLLFRFAKPVRQSWTQRFRVSGIVPETHDTNSVMIEGSNVSRFRALPGQFFILRFLQKGFWWQEHPFSLSAIPEGNRLRFTIKQSGDFTSAIPNLRPGTRVIVDGPYGVFTADPTPGKKYAFIAGGVGITPIRPLIEQIAPSNDAVLVYGSKTSDDIIFRKELDHLSSRYRFPLHYVLSHEPEHPGEKGTIDADKLSRLVPDIADREAYLCGPPPMLASLRKALRELGVSPGRIHFEKFSF